MQSSAANTTEPQQGFDPNADSITRPIRLWHFAYEPLLVFAMLLMAAWYCIVLYCQRIEVWSERIPELLALLTAFVLIAEDNSHRPVGQPHRQLNHRTNIAGPGLLAIPLLAMAAGFGRIPELFSLLMGAATVIGFLWHYRLTRHVGIWGLLILGVPILSRLPLFLGYPMRIATGMLATPMLKMMGLNAFREGTVFRIDDQLIVIDAPSSGTNMLWAAIWITLTFCVMFGLSNRKTILVSCLSLGLVVIANAIRSASLVIAEVRGLNLSDSSHTVLGLVCYAGLIGTSTAIVHHFRNKKPTPKRPSDSNLPPTTPAHQFKTPHSSNTGHRRWHWGIFSVACAVCAISPVVMATTPQAPTTDSMGEPDWPTHFRGKPLTEVEMQPWETRYAAQFPGQMKRMTDGSRQIMFQWIPQHSRAVHSAADCLRNAGFKVKHGPIIIDTDGIQWSSATATRGADTSIHLTERIESATGDHWQDVSTWYWNAVLGQSHGPYWITIVTESLDKRHQNMK